MKRRVYRINKAGSLNKLTLRTEELVPPSIYEVTVEVKSIGLNFADLFAIQGLYSATPKGSFVPGLEYSGIVVKTGDKVEDFNIGDKVLGAIKFGAYATHLNINRQYILKIPEAWSFEEAASFVVQPLTAYYSLVELGQIGHDYTVLIHSAAGGVGTYANRISKKFGAYTIGTIGTESKRDFAEKEGYEKIIVRKEDFKDQLRQALGNRKLNLVLESVGGKIFEESLHQLAPTGRIIIYGGAQFMSHSARPNYFKLVPKFLFRPKVDPLNLSNTNRSVMGFNLIYLWDKPEKLKNMLCEILKMNLKPPHIGKIYSFENLLEALKYFQSGKTIGKIVVSID